MYILGSFNAGGRTQTYNDYGKITHGFVETYHKMKQTIDNMNALEMPQMDLPITANPFENFEVYQNSEKTVLVSKENVSDILYDVMNSVNQYIPFDEKMISKFNVFTFETVIEIKDEKITGFSSIVNGSIKGLIIERENDKVTLSASVKKLGIGAKFGAKLPSLPNVSDFKESTSGLPSTIFPF